MKSFPISCSKFFPPVSAAVQGVCYLLYPFFSNFLGSWGMISREEFKARRSVGEGIFGYDFDFFPKVNESFGNDALCILCISFLHGGVACVSNFCYGHVLSVVNA